MKRPITHLRLPLLLALTICSAASTRAATLNVPSQYGTIQNAITAAQPGDIVLLADGTYTGIGNVNLDFGGKSITVTSQNGAAKTIIDCQGQARTVGVVFHSSEDAAAKLQDVTVQNGSGNFPSNYRGGDVTIIGSSPTITGCVFAGSTTTAFRSDAASHPRIDNCTFANNTGGFGAGLFAEDQVVVTGCTFAGNNTDGAGGGAYFQIANGVGSTISGCIFTGNTAGAGGGAGVYSQPFSSTIRNTFTNCVFVGNITGDNSGSGFAGEGVLTNCTFTGNINPFGAAVSTSGGSITNCILFGDNGTELSRTSTGSTAGTTTFCNIQGGYTGTGNVSIDPQFVHSPNLNSTPPDYGDLHLRTTSPLVRAGTTTGAPLTALHRRL